ncbi:MAG: alpha/beta hydrolase-fold protein [Geminicoccaceae bacterium]
MGRFLLVLLAVLAAAGAARADPRCPDTPHRLESVTLAAAELGVDKRLLVYLPPGYGCGDARRYPLLVVNDGQDLFDWNPYAGELPAEVAAEIDRRRGWYGSWRLDAQLDAAAAAGLLPPMVVVGIASDDGRRSSDLVPVAWEGASEGLGEAYGRFVAGVVVPFAERRWRLAGDRRCRTIAGASFGGVSALQIGLAHPDVFGLALALSPVLREPAIAGYIAGAWRTRPPGPPARILVDFDDDAVGAADRAWLAAVTRDAAEVALRTSPQGRHALGSWRARAIGDLARLSAASCRPASPAG